MTNTQAYNFEPDAFELERMRQVARTQDWDAGIDLAFRNILYDNERAMWVKCPEPDFDRRRSGGHDMEAHYQDYLTHECRLMDDFPNGNPYSIWHCQFIHSLAQEPHLPGGLDHYGFVMELFDAGFTAQEAAEIFARATTERYARLAEPREALA